MIEWLKSASKTLLRCRIPMCAALPAKDDDGHDLHPSRLGRDLDELPPKEFLNHLQRRDGDA